MTFGRSQPTQVFSTQAFRYDYPSQCICNKCSGMLWNRNATQR